MRTLLALSLLLATGQAFAYSSSDFDTDFSADAASSAPYRASYLMAAMCETVYDQKKTRNKKWGRLGLTEVAFKNSKKHDAQAALVTSDKYIFLVVRGTKQVKDYVQDVRLAKDHKWSKDKFKVHAGFGDQAKALYGWAKKNIAKHRGDRALWITGHSLGGAVGNLLAYRLERDAGVTVNGVMTFAPPHAGGKNWQKKFKARLGGKSWRWINRNDPIPRSPDGKAWKGVGTRYVIKKGNKLKFNGAKANKPNWLKFGAHHGSTKYLRALYKGMPSSERGSMPKPSKIK